MQLASCPFRERRPESDANRCRLVQQLLGLAATEGCDVSPNACAACATMGTPTSTAQLNGVVSSLAYALSRKIRREGGRPDCDIGRAWQCECYALATLAEEPGCNRPSALARLPSAQLANCATRRGGPAHRRRNSSTIGLVGYGTSTGLGYLNQDLVEYGAIDRWLIVEHPGHSTTCKWNWRTRTSRIARNASVATIRRWLRGLDWVVWAETSPLEMLPELARHEGKRLACVPMWEWTSPTDEWLRCVDLMICPTYSAYQMFCDWKRRFGFTWRVELFPWPIMSERFRFRCRERAERFVFINGHGGAWARGLEDQQQIGPRKGLDIVLAAAALTPNISWRVITQVAPNLVPSANVEVVQGPVDHHDLYSTGDVCVQPSRWEGIGLPLLECQAAGMPLVTVDAAPMNEYHALRTVSPNSRNWGYLAEGQPIEVPEVAPEQLASLVYDLHGNDLRASSAAARDWIERERSWRTSVVKWRQLFNPRD